MRKIAIAAALALTFGAMPLVASAQTQQIVTLKQVVAACSKADNAAQCNDLIALFVAKYPEGSIQREQAVADLVVALADSPAAKDPLLKDVIAAAISEIATNYASEAQVDAILEIAATVSDGTYATGSITVYRPESST